MGTGKVKHEFPGSFKIAFFAKPRLVNSNNNNNNSTNNKHRQQQVE